MKLTAKEKRDKLLYNLLPGERARIAAHQKHLDPITGEKLKPNANLDHDHKTGLCRGLLNPMTNKRLIDNLDVVWRTWVYLNNPPAVQAIGTVYGLIGKAQRKKVMRYGPSGAKEPIPRD